MQEADKGGGEDVGGGKKVVGGPDRYIKGKGKGKGGVDTKSFPKIL